MKNFEGEVMKRKETIADKVARKVSAGESFQRSWKVHEEAFGPILTPAFKGDEQSRVNLTAALNKVCRGDIKGGFKKLERLEKFCETDADLAAWHFFKGLCFDLAGEEEAMLMEYMDAGEFGHNFYLPYMKCATHAYQGALYEPAETDFRKAIECLEADQLDEQKITHLAYAYFNLSSTLLMMHRTSEAEEMMRKSEQIQANLPGRKAAEAILCAVKGDEARAKAALVIVETEEVVVAKATREAVEKILNGTHPHYNELEVDMSAVEAFWDWFIVNQKIMRRMIDREEMEEVLTMIQEALTPLLPFLDREIEIGMYVEEEECHIDLAVSFMVALNHTYTILLENRPKQVDSYWQFEIVH